MRNNSVFKLILLVLSITFFVSCDKDYNVIGDALIGENHFDLKPYYSSVVAYNQKIGPVQSNNLPINPLGIYNNSPFDKTSANFSTQLTMAAVDPVFGKNPEIESVYLDIPYFVDATQTKPLEAGGNSYVLDSIYGDPKAKIKLSVYESGFYMRDKDPATGFIEAQKYFTDQNTDFDNIKVGSRLNDDVAVAQNDAFFFDPAQHSVTTKDAAGKETTTYTAPSMRLKLNSEFFKTKILNAPAGQLTTNEIFKQYFKGLYFKVEQSGVDPGCLAMINFAKGTITIKYKEDTSSTDATRVEKSLVLNMSGNTVSLLEQSNPNADYTNTTSNPNRVLGDEKLYLKGGEGSLAVIELFGSADNYKYELLVNADKKPIDENGNIIPLESNGNPKSGHFLTYTKNNTPNGISDELEDIRFPLIDDSPGQIYHSIKKRVLVNNANLVFNIDTRTMANSHEPERLFLYDFTNSTTTLDYAGFSGKITRDATTNKRGLYYKLDITNHIRRLIKNSDAVNVKLGISVTQNIEIPVFYALENPTPFLSKAPAASVMSPLGTILYGNKTTDEAKKLKLEIYYTKPN